MASLPREIFKAYDIRGIVGKTLTAAIVRSVGHAVGSLAREAGRDTFAIGRDGRLSGPELAAALSEGLRAAGVTSRHEPTCMGRVAYVGSPALLINRLGDRAVFLLVTVKARHAATPCRRNPKFQAQTPEDVPPFGHGSRCICPLGAVRKECPCLSLRFDDGQLIEAPGKPFVRQVHGRTSPLAQGFDVFRPVGERHRRIQPDEVDARLLQCLEDGRVAGGRAFEPPEEAEDVQRLAIRPVGGQPRPEAEPAKQLEEAEDHFRVIVGGEGVLDDHYALAPLSVRERP